MKKLVLKKSGKDFLNVILIISAPHAPKVKAVEEELKLINKEIQKIEKQISVTTDQALQAQLQAKISELKSLYKNKTRKYKGL